MRRAFLLALAGLSCTRLRLRAGDFAPAVTVASLRLEVLGAERGVLHVRFQVENPTAVAATLVGVRFELFLEGQRFASGVREFAEPLPTGAPRVLEQHFPLALRDRRNLESGPEGAQALLRGALVARFGSVERGLPFEQRTWLKGAHGLVP